MCRQRHKRHLCHTWAFPETIDHLFWTPAPVTCQSTSLRSKATGRRPQAALCNMFLALHKPQNAAWKLQLRQLERSWHRLSRHEGLSPHP